MPEPFLHLKAQEQSKIYRALAPQLARSPVDIAQAIEKEVPHRLPSLVCRMSGSPLFWMRM